MVGLLEYFEAFKFGDRCLRIPWGIVMLRYLLKASLSGLISPIEKEECLTPNLKAQNVQKGWQSRSTCLTRSYRNSLSFFSD